MRRKRAKKVAVFGGGVAGMSCAHELAERGYGVDVYEARGSVGGKARSYAIPGTAVGGRDDLHGEHGFRFYPRFYRHVIRLMEQIPIDPRLGRRTVADCLHPCCEAGVALIGGGGLRSFDRRRPRDLVGWASVIQLWAGQLVATPQDIARLIVGLLRFAASCDARRLDKFESISWWEFIGAGAFSPSFQRYFESVPRIMVAMEPRRSSAFLLGKISTQMTEDYLGDGSTTDRTLIGPTTEVWLRPWQQLLESRGVRFHLGMPVHRLEFDARSGWISGARVGPKRALIEADYYVLAAPLEVAAELVTDEMAEWDPVELAKLKRIADLGLADPAGNAPPETRMTAWMVGMQFFLREDVPLPAGHLFFPESPWALSAISQAQFWARAGRGRFRDRYGDGSVGGVISVDISDWDRAGRFVRKPARRCTAEEIRTEVWEQMKAGINGRGYPLLTDGLLVQSSLDQDIEFPAGAVARPINRSPLLIHPPGSWFLRPQADTRTENLVLAADYVQTDTGLACMEGANEAARRAVNGILGREGYGGAQCELWPLEEPARFAAAKRLDERVYRSGRRSFRLPPVLEELWDDREPPGLDDVRRLEAELAALAPDRGGGR